MIRLTNDQMMAGSMTDREWADWYVETIQRTEFPEAYKYGPPHISKEITRNALHWVRHFGIHRRDLQGQVMTIMWGLGPNFFEHPAFRAILDCEDLTEVEKVDQLYQVPDEAGGEAYEAADFSYWYPWRVPNNPWGWTEDPELFDDLANDEGWDD